MPRTKPIKKQDLDICARLGELREMCCLTRDFLAEQANMGPEFIKRIELGLVPLRYEIATRLLPAYVYPSHRILRPVNPLWIAEGKEPIQVEWPLLLPNPKSIGVGDKVLFSTFVKDHQALLAGLVGFPPEAELPEPWLASYAAHWAKLRANKARLERDVALVENVFVWSASKFSARSGNASALLQKYREALESGESPIIAGKSFQDMLTDAATSVYVGRVKPQLPILIRKLKEATEDSGKKTALANFLRVPLASVSRWLAEDREPGGELTLRMQYWLDHPELH